MKRYIISVVSLLLLFCASAAAQTKLGNGAEFDKTIHNFGDIMLDSGPVSCTFNFTNNGQSAVVIYNVTTTCGCTDVEWTREPVRPGSKGKITVTYSNDEGPYPFDKSLTVYMSDEKKPLILKLRGVSNAKQLPLNEQYPVHIGSLGLKDTKLKCGNLEQGGRKSDAVMVANLSSSPVNLSFTNISDFLSLKVSTNPIPAGGTAELIYTVTADRSIWGKHTYFATPVINGKTAKERISVSAFTKENFSKWTDEQKQRGSMPRFDTSTYNFGKAKVGDKITATFTFKNEGKSDFQVYKVDSDAPNHTNSKISAVKTGEKLTFTVTVETKSMKKGESLTIVTLTTNSPIRPIINLFVAGVLE